ncbi:MAG: hypothetical protein FI734_00380 [SAR202 cluster bacterium]|nr:hypothetical protein [SAR202 cluster bacterium]|tara:strand:- start:1252 stop:1608 length:357 start_codon:yes stop_codon:yes gene_type:complete
MSSPTFKFFTRFFRGLKFSLIAGIAGLALSAVPALFIQSVFVAEAQRCIEAIEISNAGGNTSTKCIDEFTDPPVWLPPIILLGGAIIGTTGGLGYGIFIQPRGSKTSRYSEPERWLPF